jgi:hypothetical protein
MSNDEEKKLKQWHERHGLKAVALNRRAVEEMYERAEAEGWSDEQRRAASEKLINSAIQAADPGAQIVKFPPAAGRTPSREDLLAHYKKREPTRFAQIDGFADVPADDVMHGDESGHAILGGTTYELMSGNPEVRILIPDKTTREDAATLLRKAAEWIDRSGLDHLRGLTSGLAGEATRVYPDHGNVQTGPDPNEDSDITF